MSNLLKITQAVSGRAGILTPGSLPLNLVLPQLPSITGGGKFS